MGWVSGGQQHGPSQHTAVALLLRWRWRRVPLCQLCVEPPRPHPQARPCTCGRPGAGGGGAASTHGPCAYSETHTDTDTQIHIHGARRVTRTTATRPHHTQPPHPSTPPLPTCTARAEVMKGKVHLSKAACSSQLKESGVGLSMQLSCSISAPSVMQGSLKGVTCREAAAQAAAAAAQAAEAAARMRQQRGMCA